MRRADIEVPNLPVDVDSWGRSACYPRGSFYPLSDGPSTRNHRITKPDFRPCSTRQSRSEAPLCLCTLGARFPTALREPLGASVTFWEATAPVKLPTRDCPPTGSRPWVRISAWKGWYSTGGSIETGVPTSKPPTYPIHPMLKSNLRLQ